MNRSREVCKKKCTLFQSHNIDCENWIYDDILRLWKSWDDDHGIIYCCDCKHQLKFGPGMEGGGEWEIKVCGYCEDKFCKFLLEHMVMCDGFQKE